MAHATHHIIPRPLLLKVFLTLVALTIITALTGQADLGAFNFLHVPLAIGIAVIKPRWSCCFSWDSNTTGRSMRWPLLLAC
ncbi:hypothetical protein [Rhodothermus marinus]|uniref:hypothetical protein n=1 Tax=Rhodothermus marinus TaxID=29549 RepID=UPI000B280326|nr:hypothetical protein [Rhodothermus marinus]